MEKYVRVTLDQKKYNFFDQRYYIYKDLNGLKDDLGYIFPFEKENQVRELFKQVPNLNVLILPVPEESCHKYEIFKRQAELDNKRIAYKKKKKSFDSLPPNQQGESEQALIFHTKQQIESLEASITVAKNAYKQMEEMAQKKWKEVESGDKEKMKETCKKILESHKPTSMHDISYLPNVLKDYVTLMSKRSGTDPILVLAPLLNTLCGFFRKHHISQFGNLYPLLWQTCIMPSGSFKTTTMNLGKGLADRRESHIRELGKESAKNLGLESVTMPSSVTAAYLADALSRREGGTSYHSELKSWFRNMDQSYNTELKSNLTSFFDVLPNTPIGTKADGKRIVDRPFYSIYGVSTVEWLLEEITEKDIASGFFYRLLIHMPVCKEKEIPPARPLYDKDDHYILRKMEEDLYDQCTGLESQERVYDFTKESGNLFDTYHEEMYEQIFQESPEIQKHFIPYAKRWSPYILKIAMILQPFFEHQKQGSFNTSYFTLSCEAIEAGVAYISSAIAGTSLLFKNEIGVDKHNKECDKLLKYIARRGGVAKRLDIISNYRINGGSKSLDELGRTLEESGKLTIIKARQVKDNVYKLT